MIFTDSDAYHAWADTQPDPHLPEDPWNMDTRRYPLNPGPRPLEDGTVSPDPTESDMHVLIAGSIPDQTRRCLEASGGAYALRAAADAIGSDGVPSPLLKSYVLALLEAFAESMDKMAGPLSAGALGVDEAT